MRQSIYPTATSDPAISNTGHPANISHLKELNDPNTLCICENYNKISSR